MKLLTTQVLSGLAVTGLLAALARRHQRDLWYHWRGLRLAYSEYRLWLKLIYGEGSCAPKGVLGHANGHSAHSSASPGTGARA